MSDNGQDKGTVSSFSRICSLSCVSSASATAPEPRVEQQMENKVVPSKALQIRRLNRWFSQILRSRG